MVAFKVDDMHCEGCAKAITAAVKRADPAAELTIDLPGKLVKIAAHVPDAAVAAAIADAGFTPVTA